MKKHLVLLVCICSCLFTCQAQDSLKGPLVLYTLNPLNIGFSIYNHQGTHENQLSFGPSIELLKVGVWYQADNFGFLSEVNLTYYYGKDELLSEWVYDNLGQFSSLKTLQLTRSPQVSLVGSYKMATTPFKSFHLLVGAVCKTERWQMENGKLVENESRYIPYEEQVVGGLYRIESKMLDPFAYYRLGASLLQHGKRLIHVRFWMDVYPPYNLEYSIKEISSSEISDIVLHQQTCWSSTFGASAELRGVLSKRSR